MVLGGTRAGGNVLDDLRSDDLAGTAPGGEEVNDHKALLSKSGVEVGLAINHEEVQVSFLRFLVSLSQSGGAKRAQTQE